MWLHQPPAAGRGAPAHCQLCLRKTGLSPSCGGCSSPQPKRQPTGMGLLLTKPLRDGDHPQPPYEALPSPLKPCKGLSWVPTLPQACGTVLAPEMWGHKAAIPHMNVHVLRSQQLPGFYQHPYQFSSLPHFFKPTTAPLGTLLQPPPAAPGYQHLSGVSGFGKAPVLRDTSSHIPSSSDIPLLRGPHLPPPALHHNPHHFPPSFKFLK